MTDANGQARNVGNAAAGGPAPLRPGTVWVLAAASGVAVANLYYSQPLLPEMGRDFRVSSETMGLISALTQVGYGLGILFFVPLGDALERRRLILVLLAAVAGSLVAVAVAPNAAWLAVASLAVGMTTIAPQLLVPLAAGLAVPAERGRVVGRVMSGLLLGILLSRTVSGYVGEALGWRALFWLAAGLMAVLIVVLRLLLPRSEPAVRLSYPKLLGSLWGLFQGEPALRESCLFGAAGFGALSAFWTTLAFFASGPPYHFRSDTIGLFGLVGAAGALVAPLAGRLADVRSPRFTIGISFIVMVLSYGLFAAAGWDLAGLLAGVILLDAGAQASHISNQARIYSLPAEAHNRLNTVYMVMFFAGGAAGSSLGAFGWARWGWYGVCAVGAGLLLLGLAGFAATMNRARAGSPHRPLPHTSVS